MTPSSRSETTISNPNSTELPPICLTIAGSDPSGGAGIQADIKVFNAHDVYATTVITAVTAQNTLGVTDVFNQSTQVVEAQLKSIFDDFNIAAVKIGMLGNEEIVEKVAELLTEYRAQNIVIDPVLKSTSGATLLTEKAQMALLRKLFPQASLITPNIPELKALIGTEALEDLKSLKNDLLKMYEIVETPILLKGGHMNGNVCVDTLFDGAKYTEYSHPKIDTINTHGTGCTLSSAIAAQLAMENSLKQAIELATTYTHNCIERSKQFTLGHGTGACNI